MSATILQELKTATHAHHLEAEALVARFEWDRTEAGYSAYLLAMWGFHSAIEPVLEQACRRYALDLEPRRFEKTVALERDLEALSMDVGRAPRCGRLPALDTLPRVVGALYVLEGSTLGGQYVLRQVKRTLPATADRAGAFLTVYGADTGPMWRSFRAWVEAQATAAASGEILAGACDTFGALADWLRVVPTAIPVIDSVSSPSTSTGVPGAEHD